MVGAGVVGPAIATGLARQGRKVLLIERDWREPDRIVGELMQPAGLRALRALGMVQAVNNIEATPAVGYTVFYEGEKVSIPYLSKADVKPLEKIKTSVFDNNDKVLDDSTLSSKDYEEDEFERGVSFEHGRFITNLRNIAKNEENITTLEGTVTEIINENGVKGVVVKTGEKKDKIERIYGDLTIVCDGIFSRFRKVLSEENTPVVGSHFIALKLKHAHVPVKHTGHVILGTKFSPILVYQITPTDTRVLCAYNDTKLPKNAKIYLRDSVLPNLPEELKPSFEKALEEPIKTHPNSYLPAKANNVEGLLVLGDALNMRHPLTGGGMTVGLNDAVLIVKLFEKIPSLSDRVKVLETLLDFHYERKSLSSVINTLSVALFALFAANNSNLLILRKGCFKYFQRGGDCVDIPVGFLSGLIARPFLLTWVFFKVAFYSIYINFINNGWLLLPLSLIQIFTVLFTAARVFTPYLVSEYFS